MTKDERDDFATDTLPPGPARVVARRIVAWLTEQNDGKPPYGGGCKAFYPPDEWKDRRETTSHGALLVLVHDGGDLAPYCNHSYEEYGAMEAFASMLRTMGVFVEQSTGWCSAIYPVDEDEFRKRWSLGATAVGFEKAALGRMLTALQAAVPPGRLLRVNGEDVAFEGTDLEGGAEWLVFRRMDGTGDLVRLQAEDVAQVLIL